MVQVHKPSKVHERIINNVKENNTVSQYYDEELTESCTKIKSENYFIIPKGLQRSEVVKDDWSWSEKFNGLKVWLHCFSNVIKELRKPFANNFNLLPMKNEIKSQCMHAHNEIGMKRNNMTIGVMSNERKESLNSLNVNEF